MERVVGGYVAGTLLIASIAALAMGIAMKVLGVPYFLPLALIMMVLSLLPIVGSAIAAVLISCITFASVGLRPALVMLVIFLVYQQFEGHVLQPVVQTRTIQMNPLLITLVILAGTSLAGILGTLLALPFAGALQIILRDAFERRRARQGPEPSTDQLSLFSE
jgi:predicted PurR-regulated permease PerM